MNQRWIEMQAKDTQRTTKMTRAQQKKHKENMELPINQYLNKVDKDGKFLFPNAPKLRKYFICNPDPVLNDNRLANALLHEIRWHQQMAVKYLIAHEGTVPVEMRDKHGNIMEKEDCYLAHISEEQNVHLALSKLREHLVNRLLAKCDGEVFSFEQFDKYVGEVEKILSKMGLELFPAKVEIINPM